MALNTITQLVLPDGTEIGLADWTDRPLYSTCDLGSGFSDQEIDLFQYTAGQAVPAAAASPGFILRSSTQNDTDLATAGEMATTEEMLVYAIKPEVHAFLWDTKNFNTARSSGCASDLGTSNIAMPAATLPMLAVLSQALLIRLRISEKDYAQAGFAYYNPGFGLFGVSDMVPNAASVPSVNVVNNGLPSQEAVRSFALPNHIGGQEKYRVTLVNDPGEPVEFGKLAVLGGEAGCAVNDPQVMVRIRIYLDGLYKRPTA
jgi:hypothetical protein